MKNKTFKKGELIFIADYPDEKFYPRVFFKYRNDRNFEQVICYSNAETATSDLKEEKITYWDYSKKRYPIEFHKNFIEVNEKNI